MADIEDNSIKLVSLDPAGYYTEEDSKREEYTTPVNVDFLWFNKSEENKYLGFSDGIAKKKIDDETKNKIFGKVDNSGVLTGEYEETVCGVKLAVTPRK